MTKRKIILILFILLALMQVYVPAKMILRRESVLRRGTEYKFRAAPIDPYDPFRGKYITLSFAETSTTIQDERDWTMGETVYVQFVTDVNGFAKIKSVSKTKPPNDDFLKTNVDYVSKSGSNKLTIEFPFDTYYMEESKAYDAELAYRRSSIDTSRTTYALVRIKNGAAVLKDVMIDGIPIKEVVKRQPPR